MITLKIKISFVKDAEISFSIFITTNKLVSHVKKAKFVRSLLMIVEDCQAAKPVLRHCRTMPRFQPSSSGKRSFASYAGCRVYEKKLADHNDSALIVLFSGSGNFLM